MSKKSKKADKQLKLAIAGFVLAIVLAGGAFWYIWQAESQYGRTVEGTQALAEIMWKRQQLEKEQPAPVQDFNAAQGCCIYIEDRYIQSQRVINVPAGSPGLCLDHLDAYTQRRIQRGELAIVDIEQGTCPPAIR